MGSSKNKSLPTSHQTRDSGIDPEGGRPEAPAELVESLRATVEHLASWERGSASDGERRAAEWIAEQFTEMGLKSQIEQGEAVGNYWWPLSAMVGLGAIGGRLALRGHRLLGGLVAAIGAYAVWDDAGHGRRWFRRSFIPHRPTWNVIAEAGDSDASRTIAFISHHDAAHSGLIFHPAVVPFLAKTFPDTYNRTDTSPPVMAPVFLGPALVAAGAAIGSNKLVRTGIGLGFAIQASLIDVGMREIVPGANDNLAACAALVEIGRALAEAETPGLRILLISTGSEESNSEGMFSFAHKHFRNLKREDTVFITLEGLGSKHLTLLEGEGMLHMRDYSKMVNSELHAAAQDLGIGIRRGMRFRNSTDGVFALRGGYPAAMFGSINELRIIDNYHWPTDTPDNVDYQTCARAVGVSVRFIQRLLEGERWPWRPRTPAGEWRSLSRD